MKQLIIISTSPEGRVAKRIYSCAETAGLQARICTIDDAVYLRDDELQNAIILPRIAPHMNKKSIDILRKLELRGAIVVNSATSWDVSRDKWKSYLAFNEADVPTPVTMIVPGEAYETYASRLGGPFIFKPREGTHGEGIEIITSSQELLEKVGLAQQYIEESQGSDIRVFVVGNKAVAAMKRIAQPNEFRANLHQGATGEKFEMDEQIKRIAVHASKSLGLTIAGVDIVLSHTGPLVLEVNPSPGLGIETYANRSVVDDMIDLIKTL